MLNCLFVGVGGFLGAVARYLCTRLPLAPEGVLSGGTFSKVLFPPVRLGYLVAPRQLVASLCAQKRLSDTTPTRSTSLRWRRFCATGSSSGTLAA
ncbi:MAG: hypothetical protein ACI4PA_01360 [Oscillospiraceae bacterium]